MNERKKTMKNRFNLINTLIDSSNEELVNFLDYHVLKDYVCDTFSNCEDCYFNCHEGKCIFHHSIDINVGKKLIVEWLEKGEENNE